MDEFLLLGLIIVLAFLLMFYLRQTALEGPRFVAKPCKPHAWAYFDGEWLTEHSQDLEERLKSAILVCKNCRKHPSEDSGSKHGEYE